jgi:hypothetical protein
VLNAEAAGSYELRTANIVRHPDRYRDKRGRKIWEEVLTRLAEHNAELDRAVSA